MRAVIAAEAGGPEVLSVGEVPDPEPGPGEVLIDVAATAVNRADLLQRQGFYPPPPGASDVHRPGVQRHGRGARRRRDGWAVGDEVCALLAGGGYAERVAVPAGQLLPVPDRRRPGDRRRAARGRVHGLVERVHGRRAAARRDVPRARRRRRHRHDRDPARPRTLGARVLTTARVRRRSSRPAPSSAPTSTINYRDEDFVEVVREQTDGHGADVILDNMGAKYLGRNVDGARDRGPAGDHRHAGRHQGRARHRRAAAQARRGDRRPLLRSPAGRARRPRSARRWSSTCGRWSPTGRCGRSCTARMPLAEVAAAHR